MTKKELYSSSRELINELKKARIVKGLSYNDILKLLEKNGDYLSKSTLSRVFSVGSEERTFRIDITLWPLTKVLLENDDEEDETVYISALEDANQHIVELQRQLETLRVKNSEEELLEREEWHRIIDFMKDQISKKDYYIDALLAAV